MNPEQQPEHRYDIVIVGAGPVGLLLFNLLKRLSYRVALIEKRAQIVGEDIRSYILNRKLIDELLAGDILDGSAIRPMRLMKMIVSHSSSPIKFRLNAPDEARCIKYIVNANDLQRALLGADSNDENIYTGTTLLALTNSHSGVELAIEQSGNKSRLNCSAIVLADGARSPSAKLLNIEAQHTASSHSALVLNLDSDRSLPTQAEQCLTPHGPISVVPGTNGNLVGVIVSTSEKYLQSLSQPGLVDKLMAETFHGRYGRLQQVGKPAVFPIQPLRRHCRHQRALLVGDACCTLSPVAAQGLSLGMDAAMRLYQSLAESQPRLERADEWQSFALSWEGEYRQRYRIKQRLNQMYARMILNMGLASHAIAPGLALAGLSRQIRSSLVRLLSE